MPRFMAQESWDNSGDVDVWFVDNVTPDLKDRVNRELSSLVVRLPDNAKSVYHVEELVKYVLHKMRKDGHLRISKSKKQWAWVEEV